VPLPLPLSLPFTKAQRSASWTSPNQQEGEYVPTSILLTGGAGFIGSNTMVYIMQQHPNVRMICLDKVDYCANTKNFQEVMHNPNFTFVKGDITSADLVNQLITAYKVDTIMHFAAETHVDNSFGQSLCFTQTNVLGTHVLLESAKAHMPQIRRFIHVSTDEVLAKNLDA
jgi:dTDP-D-glucose 4,6-dehydratase